MLQMFMQALVGDASGDLARPNQRRVNTAPPKSTAAKPWFEGKAPAGKCVSCFLAHHSPKCVICRSGASVVLPLSDPKCPPASKVHKADKPASGQPAPKPKAAPKASPAPSSTPDTGAQPEEAGGSPLDTASMQDKPLVSIPAPIAKHLAKMEAFLAQETNTGSDQDATMGPTEPQATPHMLSLQAQLDLFGPSAAVPNPEVFGLLTKQLADAKSKQTAVVGPYDMKVYLDARKAIESHKQWAHRMLKAEEEAIELAEAALKARRDKLYTLQQEMETWFTRAQEVIAQASTLVDPLVAGNAADVGPVAEPAPNIARDLGVLLGQSKNERKALIEARATQLGRPLTPDEFFELADQQCALKAVEAIGSVNLAIAPPTVLIPSAIATPVCEPTDGLFDVGDSLM